MIGPLLKTLKNIFSNPATRKAVEKAGHVFSKHPMKHADKAVRAAFKVGVKTGEKFERLKNLRNLK